MSQGTLTLTNNSTAVTGSGTAFTADLKSNDFIAVVVGGVTYTLGVTAVTNNTGVVLTTPYTGPTAQNLAWTAIPNATLVGITASLAADVSRIIRGLNLDKNNWQQVYSGAGDISVYLADGSSFRGPSWNKLSTDMATKVSTTDPRLNTVEGKTGGVISSGVIVSGGFMSRTTVASEVNSASQPVSAATYTSSGSNLLERGRIGMHMGISATGIRVGQITVTQDGGGAKVMTFRQDTGDVTCPGVFTGGSDIRMKYNIKEVSGALSAVLSWRGCTYRKIDGGSEVGLLAQDVEKDCPEAVVNMGEWTFSTGLNITDLKGLNTAGVAAAYHTEAIKQLLDIIELSLSDPQLAKKQIAALRNI